MRRVVGPRRLATASETNARRPPTFSTRESAASTEAPSPSTFIFGTETAITNHPIPSDDGQHPAAAFNFATAAASSHARAKHSSRTAVTAQPRWSSSTASCPTGAGKRQKTVSARKDLCCPCLILSTCSERNCPCAKAWRPCRNCDLSHGHCANTVAAHDAAIRETNCEHLPSSTAARFRARMGLPPRPLIPLIVEPAECTGDDSESATTASPTTQRHIRRVQRQDGTQSTSSGASREGDDVAMSPDGGDTSPPPLNSPRATVWSRSSVPTAAPLKPSHVPRRNATLTHRHRSMHHCCRTTAPLRRLPQAVSPTIRVPRPPPAQGTPPACNH